MATTQQFRSIVQFNYRPQWSCGKVMFLHLSVTLFMGGVCLWFWGYLAHPPPGRYTLPLDRHPPGQTPARADPLHSSCWDTVNKRAVRVLLECILVQHGFAFSTLIRFTNESSWQSYLNLLRKQECIPVGCVPTDCWPYPSMHWAGGSAQGGLPGGCLPGGCLPGGVCPGRVSVWGGGRHPSVDRMTDRCKNVTLPQLKICDVGGLQSLNQL